MNYLGHAMLSLGRPGILAGNMIGDYVKGLAVLDTFPEEIKKGIVLHRKIDAYADNHPASLRARNLFRPDYRLYSGAFVDSLYDHFLANDPHYFPDHDALKKFTTTVYSTLDEYETVLPEKFLRMFGYMRKEDWLYSYRTMKGMEVAFERLVHRARYMDNSERAYHIFVAHYYELNQWYFELIDDMVRFVKNELSN